MCSLLLLVCGFLILLGLALRVSPFPVTMAAGGVNAKQPCEFSRVVPFLLRANDLASEGDLAKHVPQDNADYSVITVRVCARTRL